jgi:hypothetical protein
VSAGSSLVEQHLLWGNDRRGVQELQQVLGAAVDDPSYEVAERHESCPHAARPTPVSLRERTQVSDEAPRAQVELEQDVRGLEHGT